MDGTGHLPDPAPGPTGGFRRLSRFEASIKRRRHGRPALEVRRDAAAERVPAGAAPETTGTGEFGKRVAIATVIVLAILAGALALWRIRLVIALLALAFTIAAAMRPGVDALRRRGVPRGLGIAIHYAGLAAIIALAVWLIVPQAIDQVQQALGGTRIADAARNSTGVKHDILVALDRELHRLPSGSDLVPQAVEVGRRAFETLIGVFFVFATAAYWIIERDRAVDVVASLVSRHRRKRLRDTWTLIDLKLGAYVRGQLLLVILVAATLSLAFWLIHLPYWLLIGSFAGVVEIVPVIGPLAAGVLAAGVGLSESVQVGVLAVAGVIGVRLIEDYFVMPRVLGHSVGLSPLIVLASVTSVGILFGGFAVVLAIPIAVLLVTVVDVVLRSKDPTEEEVPRVIFSARDAD